jgi:hypothetical protein
MTTAAASANLPEQSRIPAGACRRWEHHQLMPAICTSEAQWWALIPGGIMALIGEALRTGGAREANTLDGTLWPLVLKNVGAACPNSRFGHVSRSGQHAATLVAAGHATGPVTAPDLAALSIVFVQPPRDYTIQLPTSP